LPPFLGVGEFGVDVEDDASEGENPMSNDLSDRKFGESRGHGPAIIRKSADWKVNEYGASLPERHASSRLGILLGSIRTRRKSAPEALGRLHV
jgi:hypothetical protein